MSKVIFYKSYADCVLDMHRWSATLPEFAAVCGIPRSGIVPAAALALHRNIHLVSLESLLAGEQPWLADHHGAGRGIPARDGPVLVIDDTASSGRKMREIKALLHNRDVRYAAYASNSEGNPELDFCLHELGETDNLFEWNIFHHQKLNAVILTDLDGVLCEDWHHQYETGDMEDKYLDHLDNARCLLRPTQEALLGIVTSRLEKHRGRTEAWLRRNNIPYKWLAMCPCTHPIERAQNNDFVQHKVRVYRDWAKEACMFVESDPSIANAIYQQTGLPVLSWGDQRYLRPNPPDPTDGLIYSHAGEIGDLIAALPVLAHRGGGHLRLVRHDCTGNRMTPERAEMLRPLLEVQPYVKSVRWSAHYEGERLDKGVRETYRNHLNLSDMQCDAFGVPHWPRDKPWLHVPEPKKLAKYVVTRSSRYHNWNTVPCWKRAWERYHQDMIFLGTPEEHRDFCLFIGPIAYYRTHDLLDAARVIAGAERGFFNQTGLFWIAESLKIPISLEVCPYTSNCHFDRAANRYWVNEAGD